MATKKKKGFTEAQSLHAINFPKPGDLFENTGGWDNEHILVIKVTPKKITCLQGYKQHGQEFSVTADQYDETLANWRDTTLEEDTEGNTIPTITLIGQNIDVSSEVLQLRKDMLQFDSNNIYVYKAGKKIAIKVGCTEDQYTKAQAQKFINRLQSLIEAA